MSVDLPIPGSPPTSVTEPCTRPPPSTRSSSSSPVERRIESCDGNRRQRLRLRAAPSPGAPRPNVSSARESPPRRAIPAPSRPGTGPASEASCDRTAGTRTRSVGPCQPLTPRRLTIDRLRRHHHPVHPIDRGAGGGAGPRSRRSGSAARCVRSDRDRPPRSTWADGACCSSRPTTISASPTTLP